MRTSVVHCLLPQDSLQVLCPGILHLPANCLKCVCILSFPLPEPYLKTQATVTAVLGQAYIRRLNMNKDKLIMQDGSLKRGVWKVFETFCPHSILTDLDKSYVISQKVYQTAEKDSKM